MADDSKAARRTFWIRRAAALGAGVLVIGGVAGAISMRETGGDEAPSRGAAPATSPEGGPDASAAAPDTQPPVVEITSRLKGLDPFDPVKVTGEIDEDATLRLAGKRKQVSAGTFKVSLPQPPRGPVTIRAEDEAGNLFEEELDLSIKWPPMRAVHVSGYAWATPSFRRTLLRMIDDRLINTIQLDLKDESGIISYASKIPLAKRIGSATPIYDLRDAIRTLHRKGVRVVGRIVCFRDPILAKRSWPKHKERVIQTPGGVPYANYGGFTNFADDVVRDYNIDVAEEAARAGIDDILYDYVRRPDGPLSNLRFPGLKTSPEKAITRFVRETRQRLDEMGTKLGLSVYGIAATRPKEIAQPIDRLARYSDYISPMVYPSHWASGEYNVGDPNREPYKIVFRSLKDFKLEVKGTGASVIPWLQDFSLGVTYGPQQVRDQIRAAKDRGIDEWILWDPHVTYTSAALDPTPSPKS